MPRDEAARAATDTETPTCPTCGAPAMWADGDGGGFVCANDDCPDHGELVG